MIPTAYITEWQQTAPWSQPDMVEQDLVMCRVIVDLFSNEHIAQHLAFRGGTALYKLRLVPAARYSEDIDLVQVDAEPIGPTLDGVRAILDPWLGRPRYDARDQSFRLTYRFDSDTGTPNFISAGYPLPHALMMTRTIHSLMWHPLRFSRLCQSGLRTP